MNEWLKLQQIFNRRAMSSPSAPFRAEASSVY